MTKRDFIKMCGGAALAGAAMPVWAAKGKKKPYTGRKVRIAALAEYGRGKTRNSNERAKGMNH